MSDATVSADGKTATYKVSNVSPGYGDLGKGIYYHASDFDKRILDGNGGKTTKGESWISVTDAGTYNLPDDKFTLEGKTFNGWNSKADGTGTSYKAGDVLHIGARVYVVWANQQ